MKQNPIKRIFDMVAASIGLVVFLPVFFVVTLLILLEDGGPVLFVQERLGKEMRMFRIYKFRSMREGRVTRVGGWIRATGLDELLQFFNVLGGSMSMVGPRPMTMEDVTRLDWQDPALGRWRCKPGMTGLAQLFAGKGRSVSRFFDDRYAGSYSLFLDSRIVFLSFMVNCFGKGPVKRVLSCWRNWQRNRRRRTDKGVTRKNLPLYGLGMIVILSLKGFYSTAGVDDLVWVLQPLAFLVELITGIQFQYDPAVGFVSLASRVVIAPACAGVNFFIICFATIFFTLVSRLDNPMKKWAWLVISIISAYLVTLLGNSFRIMISIYLYRADIYGEWATPERVHRLAGMLIYVPILVITYLAAERMVGRLCRKKSSAAETAIASEIQSVSNVVFAPFAWYLAISVFMPLLNGSLHRYGPRYLEHSVFVLVATLCIFLGWLVLNLLKKKIDIIRETKEKRAS
ncbi:glycosyltransferase [Geotalea daltonii FRC-32]|uniref:Glycosyltransferase n=1 Tax=Geotalea daltonii (strain DSM 22248 / JCM 15807 / FRC-32) TaxID=316067 RepID=B9M6W8_GEODF|nr:exosortase K [Geotalea daltonii]ACM21989.1 glycosyltransferase [Geotalea daltonii FRC-32]